MRNIPIKCRICNEWCDNIVKHATEKHHANFGPKFCICGKIALYKVNRTPYCAEHKNSAVTRLQIHARNTFEVKRSVIENQQRKFDISANKKPKSGIGVSHRLDNYQRGALCK
jgi:hypothetical protein